MNGTRTNPFICFFCLILRIADLALPNASSSSLFKSEYWPSTSHQFFYRLPQRIIYCQDLGAYNKKNLSYFFTFIDWQLSCPNVERNKVLKRCCVRCVNMMVVVALSPAEFSSNPHKNSPACSFLATFQTLMILFRCVWLYWVMEWTNPLHWNGIN